MTCNKPELADYLTNFSGTDPLRVVYCPFVQDAGAGMGLTTFSMIFFGAIGIALTIRTQHPAPIVVAGILSAGVIAPQLPGGGARIFAVALFLAISAIGFVIYRLLNNSSL